MPTEFITPAFAVIFLSWGCLHVAGEFPMEEKHDAMYVIMLCYQV